MNTAANEQSTEAVTLTDASDDDLKAMGLPPSFTLDSLKEFLEPEEIAALGEGDDPLLEVPDDAKPAGKGTSAFDAVRGNNADPEDDPDEDADEGDEDNDEAKADDPAEADAAGDAAGDAADTDELTIPDADKPDPELKRADVSEDETIVENAKEQRKELRRKYSEGEMTDDELDEGLEELTEKVADAKFRIREAKAVEQASANEYANAWYGRVNGFMEQNPAFSDNTPRQELQGHSALQLFDVCLRHVTDPQKAPQFAHLTQAQKLAEGAKLAKAEFKRITGQDMAVPTKTKAEEPAPKAEPKPKEKVKDKATDDPRPKPVQTLADVTSASENEITDGQFAALDRANGLDAEREFGRMTPDQQEAYLRDVS